MDFVEFLVGLAANAMEEYRDRSLCCKANLAHNSKLYMDECGWDYNVEKKGFYERENCNTFCAYDVT